MAQSSLTVVNHYALNGTGEAFVSAIAALAGRVEAEGHRGVLSYRFFVNAGEGTARAVIDYADPSAWIGHHDIAMTWPEMGALHRAAALTDVTFLGPLTEDIRNWLQTSRLTAAVHSGYHFAAGFRRD